VTVRAGREIAVLEVLVGFRVGGEADLGLLAGTEEFRAEGRVCNIAKVLIKNSHLQRLGTIIWK